ncbi:trifunctional histidinol dehydrogenase, partial [Cladochytrium tenue]
MVSVIKLLSDPRPSTAVSLHDTNRISAAHGGGAVPLPHPVPAWSCRIQAFAERLKDYFHKLHLILAILEGCVVGQDSAATVPDLLTPPTSLASLSMTALSSSSSSSSSSSAGSAVFSDLSPADPAVANAFAAGVDPAAASMPRDLRGVAPRRDGAPVPEVVYVAQKVGATAIVLADGAQAVAAMAFGAESVPKVDKIVVADEDLDPAYVPSDLLSQAEHGPDSQVVLVAAGMSDALVAAIEKQIRMQGEVLPRAAIVRASIPKSFVLLFANVAEAMRFSNDPST